MLVFQLAQLIQHQAGPIHQAQHQAQRQQLVGHQARRPQFQV